MTGGSTVPLIVGFFVACSRDDSAGAVAAGQAFVRSATCRTTVTERRQQRQRRGGRRRSAAIDAADALRFAGGAAVRRWYLRRRRRQAVRAVARANSPSRADRSAAVHRTSRLRSARCSAEADGVRHVVDSSAEEPISHDRCARRCNASSSHDAGSRHRGGRMFGGVPAAPPRTASPRHDRHVGDLVAPPRTGPLTTGAGVLPGEKPPIEPAIAKTAH